MRNFTAQLFRFVKVVSTGTRAGVEAGTKVDFREGEAEAAFVDGAADGASIGKLVFTFVGIGVRGKTDGAIEEKGDGTFVGTR